MTPQPKRSETARSSIEPSDIASDYRSVLENAPGGSATSPHDPTRDLAVLSRPLPHPIDRTRSAFDVPGPEAPPPFGSRSGPAFSTPPNISPSMESPEEPAPVREFAGIPVLDSDGEQSSRDGYDGHSAATVAVSPPSRTLGIRGGPCAGTGATSQKTGCTVGTNQTAPMGGSGSGSRKSDARRAQLEASVENAVLSGFGIEDEKKASLHNEPERESPATPGGDPLRVENGGTPAGTFSSHHHRFLTILEDGKLRDLGCDVPVDGGVCGLTFEEAMEQAFCRWHYSHRREGIA